MSFFPFQLWYALTRRPKKILIVDDEEGVRMLYSMELQDEGYDVITLPNGRDLLKVLECEHPDCVVMDIKMREHDGLDLLQDIRRNHYDLPVIIYTTYSSFRVSLKVVSANLYITKSSDLRELKEGIVYCLESIEYGGRLLSIDVKPCFPSALTSAPPSKRAFTTPA